jgi:hypothetical protein
MHTNTPAAALMLVFVVIVFLGYARAMLRR